MGDENSAVDLGAVMPEVQMRVVGGDRAGFLKADAIGGQPGRSEQREVSAGIQQLFTQYGAVEPPYDQEMLCLLFEHSSALRPPVDAYSTNIDGFGYRLEPVFSLDSDAERQKVIDALRRRETRKDTGDNNAADLNPDIEDETLEAQLAEIGEAMVAERAKLTRFFDNCCDEHSFVKLRMLTRQDLEVMGNAYWEVLRNKRGEIAQLVYVPAFSIRLLPRDKTRTPTVRKVLTEDMTFEDMPRLRQFRRMIQVVEQSAVFFREFGDPRLISSKTGEVWGPDANDVIAIRRMQEEEGEGAAPATELKHFRVESPRSAYGIPRWIGALLSVLGSRMSEEVNFLYFDNKSVPPLAILVSGGRLTENSVKRIESYIQTELKGRHNFHKILVLEAEPAVGTQKGETSSKLKIELRPLTSAQQQDALFQKYDERNIDKAGGAFRLPRLLRGDIRDFNRSTAMAALNFAEMQVFNPLREDFDWIINHDFMTDLGALYWKFASRAPVTRDPVAMSEMIKNLTNASVLVPEEGRELAADVFNREFSRLESEWSKQPLALTLAGIGAGADGVAGQQIGEAAKAAAESTSTEELFSKIVKLRKIAETAEQAAIDRVLGLAMGDEFETETVTIPRSKMEELLADEAPKE